MVTVEEGCQEEAQKRKGREEGEADEDGGEGRIRNEIAQEVVAGIKEKASAQDDVKVTAQREQWGKVSCEAGIALKSKMKKRRKAGEKGTRWQHGGMKSKSWRRSWNEEGWKETLLQLEIMQQIPEPAVHERMSQGKGLKG